jgi:hypothetical protein
VKVELSLLSTANSSFPVPQKIQFNFRDESLPPEILKLSEFSIKLVDEQGNKLVLNKKNPYGIFIH